MRVAVVWVSQKFNDLSEFLCSKRKPTKNMSKWFKSYLKGITFLRVEIHFKSSSANLQLELIHLRLI